MDNPVAELLGKDLVVWRNPEGTWATFDDRCPHRAAPLTEGRVEKDGSLLCAYHAWRFDSDGKCLSIPQSESGGRDEAQPSACAKVYPTQVAQGIIWVWGENGPDAVLESAVTSPPLIAELNDAEAVASGRVTAGAIYQRDLPYSWETFLENVVDPSHVVVAHHGIMGNRDMAAPVRIEVLADTYGKDGFIFKNNSPVEDAPDGFVEFRAPSLVMIDTMLEEGSILKLALYCVPTRPGWCRMVSSQMSIAPKDKDTKARQLIPTPGGLQPHQLPDWLQHMFGHLFMHQDMVFLHHQEKILASDGDDKGKFTKGIFVPAEADVGVVTLKKWIREIASGGPAWAKGCDTTLPSRELKRDVLFDVYEQHTKSCTSCMGALKRVNQGLPAAKAAAVASLVWAVLKGARAVGASASPTGSVLNLVTARAMVPGLALMFTSLGSMKVLETVQKSLTTGSYHHQDND
eukprot:jgi/Undpi1/11948/HiC_scaffold_4.g01647.m1